MLEKHTNLSDEAQQNEVTNKPQDELGSPNVIDSAVQKSLDGITNPPKRALINSNRRNAILLQTICSIDKLRDQIETVQASLTGVCLNFERLMDRLLTVTDDLVTKMCT